MKALGAFDVCGLSKRVVLGTKAEAELTACDQEGAHDPIKGLVWVIRETGEEIEPTRARDTIAHEWAHALIEGTGVRTELQEQLQLSDEAYERFEERLVRMMTPGIVSSLKGLHALVGNLATLEKKLVSK